MTTSLSAKARATVIGLYPATSEKAQADYDKQRALKLCVKMLGKGEIVDALEGGAGLRGLIEENSGR